MPPALDHYTTVLRRDHHRIQSIHRRLSASNSTTTVPARLGLPFHTMEYVVTIGIGTPAQNLTLLFDTGSDLTWVQCKPCTPGLCYPQEEPLFDPSSSTTYENVACSSQECQIGGGQETGCRGSSCRYSVTYGDSSEDGGNLALDTFYVAPKAPQANGVVFGCSDTTKGFNDMTVAGLLGLGRGDSSIISQNRQSYNDGVFSYCLPPHGSSAGYLTFGIAGPAGQSPANMSFTPLINPSDPRLSSFYMVDLAGISVNGAGLPIPAGTFSSGTIVDSGTVITRIPRAAYYPLRDEFRRQMASKGYTMLPEGSVQDFDTCYDLTGHDVVMVPPVALEFAGGARIDVDPSGILLVVDASGTPLACLAFLPMDADVFSAIIGNMQQRAYNVLFDAPGGRLGFAPNGCT
ncbi:hypothetical protein EJB05_45124, partial [Eragrostis curvula]